MAVQLPLVPTTAVSGAPLASRSTPSSSAVVSLAAKGLPVFRAEASAGESRIDLAAALQLEQECLSQEDRRRAGRPA
jgi:hypothetical protein